MHHDISDFNNSVNDLHTQVILFLNGGSIDVTEFLLKSYANHPEHRGNAAAGLADVKCPEEKYLYILELIVGKSHAHDYFEQYHQWLNEQHLEENLLSFLEFLAYQKHHRIKTFLKLAQQTNPTPYYRLYFLGGAAIVAAAAGYFNANPLVLNQVIDWVIHQAPTLIFNLLACIFSPLNIPKVSSAINFLTLAFTLRLILNNHVTDTWHKIKKTLKHFLQHGLVMLAQVLCYLDGGILTPAISLLFIFSSLSITLFTIEEFINLKKPPPYSKYEQGNSLEYIKAIEQQCYYDQKWRQLLIDSVSFVIFSIGYIVVINTLLPLPYLNIFFIVFQFLINLAKDEYLKSQERQDAERMQTNIRNALSPQNRNAAQSTDAFLPPSHPVSTFSLY